MIQCIVPDKLSFTKEDTDNYSEKLHTTQPNLNKIKTHTARQTGKISAKYQEANPIYINDYSP